MQSSRPSTSSWCPLDILCIDPEGDASCVGIACSKNRKCKVVVAKATRTKAQKLLDEIAQLPANAEEVRQKLIDLAHYLLCKRFHQNQADEMMEKWWSKIQQSTELSPQNLTPPPSPRVSGRHNTPSIRSNRTRLTSRNTNVQSAATISSAPSRGPAAVSTPPPSPRPTVGRRNSSPRQNNQQSDNDDNDDDESVLSLTQEHHDSVLISSSIPNNVRSSPHETNGIDLTDCCTICQESLQGHWGAYYVCNQCSKALHSGCYQRLRGSRRDIPPCPSCRSREGFECYSRLRNRRS